MVLKGKYHYRFERSETASTAASTENTCAIWYENVFNIFLHVVCLSQISSYCRSRLTKCLIAYENGCRFIIQLVVSVTFKCDEPRLKMSHEGAAQV